jgi:hypothetical protein
VAIYIKLNYFIISFWAKSQNLHYQIPKAQNPPGQVPKTLEAMQAAHHASWHSSVFIQL